MTKLYILCGIPFSGKSTLAKKIVQELGFTRIDLDEVKFDLYGEKITDAEIDQAGWDYIYQDMYKRIEDSLKNGKSVLHDTGNFTRYERKLVRNIADKLGLESRTIYVDTPVKVAKERLLKNRQNKERFNVTDEDFQSTVDEMEPPAAEENPLVFKPNDSIDEFISSLEAQ